MNGVPAAARRGLTAAEVRERVAAGRANDVPRRSSRSAPEIVRANVLTRFNALIGSLLALVLIFGQWQDALFGLIIVANSAIGAVQELRAKRTLDRLAVIGETPVRVRRDGAVREVAQEPVLAGALGADGGHQRVPEVRDLADRPIPIRTRRCAPSWTASRRPPSRGRRPRPSRSRRPASEAARRSAAAAAGCSARRTSCSARTTRPAAGPASWARAGCAYWRSPACRTARSAPRTGSTSRRPRNRRRSPSCGSGCGRRRRRPCGTSPGRASR